ncbi:MAG: AzlD domain-containing protein [Firmicutes bacterium]|nr:AzlD domain-containing protein [Bacillota bacterium]
MTGDLYLLIAIAIAALATFALRVLPFLIFGEGRPTPPVVLALGKMLPGAVMAMLVVYCLKGTDLSLASGWMPALAASLLVVATYVWKRNSLLSIVVGTALYMALVQLVF